MICFTQIDPDVDFAEHSVNCKQEQMTALSKYFNTELVFDKQDDNQTIKSKYQKVKLSKTQKKAIRYL